MSSTQGMLGSTVKKISELMSSSDGNYMMVLILFIILVFIIIWKFFK